MVKRTNLVRLVEVSQQTPSSSSERRESLTNGFGEMVLKVRVGLVDLLEEAFLPSATKVLRCQETECMRNRGPIE
jgi:hypothetical protein